MAYKTNPGLLLLLAIIPILFLAVQGQSYTQLPGRLTWVTISEEGDIWGVDGSQVIFNFQNGNWATIPGLLVQISAGASGVWGVTKDDFIFKWNGSGWDLIPGLLRRVSSGNFVWGVTRDGHVFRYNSNGQWDLMPGRLREISAADNGEVWGVSPVDEIFRWDNDRWTRIPGKFKNVAVGSVGVWAVNRRDELFLWNQFNAWIKLQGSFTQLDSGKSVVGVTRDGLIFKGL